MAQRAIEPVKDNHDKQRTYQEQLKKHKRAMTGEFYFEAIMIDYALMEDRLHSMLYHMGFLADRLDIKLYKKNRPLLVEMVTACMDAEAAKKLGISNITGKLKLIRSVVHWAANAPEEQSDKYRAALNSRCRELDLQELEQTLDAVVNWCEYRNEIVHAMMNKNMDSLSQFLRERAEEGLRLARTLDSHLRILKKRGRIRTAAGLPTDQA